MKFDYSQTNQGKLAKCFGRNGIQPWKNRLGIPIFCSFGLYPLYCVFLVMTQVYLKKYSGDDWAAATVSTACEHQMSDHVQVPNDASNNDVQPVNPAQNCPEEGANTQIGNIVCSMLPPVVLNGNAKGKATATHIIVDLGGQQLDPGAFSSSSQNYIPL
ncbi:hypothetical protein K7X08_004416 [Anisodus acutangulus]|uniref:Uncharacterized protein n=1 Tax=Anisodus acutangulus TaxID=402998 RepID=A0A9Q1MKP0_9SOLA|nr:hypothetical protein K7X08_004416 [Anisodus acutangulus]